MAPLHSYRKEVSFLAHSKEICIQDIAEKGCKFRKKKMHIEQGKLEAGEDGDIKDLDLKYVNKCSFEAEDIYPLDGHLWSKHEYDGVNFVIKVFQFYQIKSSIT